MTAKAVALVSPRKEAVMARGLNGVWVLAAAAVIAVGTPSRGTAPCVHPGEQEPERYAIGQGTIVFEFNAEALESLDLTVMAHDQGGGSSLGRRVTFTVEAPSTVLVETVAGAYRGIGGGELHARGAFLLERRGSRALIANPVVSADSEGVFRVAGTFPEEDEPEVAFELTSVTNHVSAEPRHLGLVGGVSITESWAWDFGIPDAAGAVIGTMALNADLGGSGTQAVVSCAVRSDEGSQDARGESSVIGPDVIIGDLQGMKRHCALWGITAFSVATNACNVGTLRAKWISYTNQHPLIFSSMFRLKDDRFEQIGMSWLKHGFYAVSESLCGPCNDPTNGSELGVGCSDPYSSDLNGVQTNMSPRSTANANTGYFPYPWEGWEEGPPNLCIERRLQVHNEDMDPLLNEGAMYFIQGHYIHPGDAAFRNGNNTASYRPIHIVFHNGEYRAGIEGATQREQPAIRAWQDYDPSVVETDIQVPDEGLFILAAKTTEVGATGFWRYSYALENLNSDRSAKSFTVPIFPGVQVENFGFHDVDYHSGEPYEPYQTDWTVTVESHSITWSTESYDVNPDANALRFSTLYNFYFDASVPAAQDRTITIGLFKPGALTHVTGKSIAPSSSVSDCNGNQIPDPCDLDCGEPGGPCDVPGCGESIDCDGNTIPDECQLDCNDNGVADTCDILFGTSRDCNENRVPDECETDCNDNGIPDDCDIDPSDPDGDGEFSEDCQPNAVPDECDFDCDGDGVPSDCDDDEDWDRDGVDDCLDECPYTTPQNGCECPELDRCCWGALCLPNFPRIECFNSGGVPDCVEADCRDGCLFGDFDRDGDVDLRDVAELQIGFSGPGGEPGFETPPMSHLFAFDTYDDDGDGDGDIDLTDFRDLRWDYAGPIEP